MRKIRILLIVLFLFQFIMLASVNVTANSDSNVEVKIPTFNVWLNGTLVNNVVNEYPLVVYKDITYFPMTWSDSRFLGLVTSWDERTGLSVQKTTNYSKYSPYETYINDTSKNYKAEIASFKINVNGKQIDNSHEKYPLLIFRDVTYFPLTWRYAVDEFGWKYSWKNGEGLYVESDNNVESEANNVLAIINNRAFSNYNFHVDVTLHDGDEKLDGIQGSNNVEFKFTEFQNVDYHKDEYIFRVRLSQEIPLIYDIRITGFGRAYNLEDKNLQSYSNGIYGRGGNPGTRMHFSDFVYHPLYNVNKFEIIGSIRDSIVDIQPTTNTMDKINRYIITFDKNSIFAKRKMEAKINWETLQLEELVFEDVSEEYGEYKLDVTFED